MSKKWTETEIVLLKNCIEDGYTLVRIQEQFFQNGYKRTVGSLKYKVKALGLELTENETYQSVTDTVQDEMIGDLTSASHSVLRTVCRPLPTVDVPRGGARGLVSLRPTY